MGRWNSAQEKWGREGRQFYKLQTRHSYKMDYSNTVSEHKRGRRGWPRILMCWTATSTFCCRTSIYDMPNTVHVLFLVHPQMTLHVNLEPIEYLLWANFWANIFTAFFQLILLKTIMVGTIIDSVLYRRKLRPKKLSYLPKVTK